jgi:hypothetical protein
VVTDYPLKKCPQYDPNYQTSLLHSYYHFLLTKKQAFENYMPRQQTSI